MAEPFIGEIRAFGFNFQPRGWLFCNGQLLPIQNFTPLFSILGTTYGGNGTSTFGLPNLQGQAPMHWGKGLTGLVSQLGQVQGQSSVTLTSPQMPTHTHPIIAQSVPAGSGAERTPGPKPDSFLAETTGGLIYQPPPSTPNTAFAPGAISPNGSSLPHENMQPYLVLNFCIATEGIFPSRN